jgi:F-type H+-transporting ATPase subunit alpha
MYLRPDEITSVLMDKISDFDFKVETAEVGHVVQVGDGIAIIYGLDKAMAGEVIEFPNGIFGLVQNLEEDNVGAIILGPYTEIKEGDIVTKTNRVLDVPVGEGLLGRVINAIGDPIDGKGPLEHDGYALVERPAPDILSRQSVNEPMQTGLKAIDALVPIGKGQRELIIGDRQTGKTAIAVDTIINQKDTGVISIYVAIGKKASSVVGVIEDLATRGAMKNTIVVSACASEPAPMLFLAPYAGCAIAEYFMERGKDVLIIYDDLSKHAVAYRELSLLLRRPPGREAFPGDVFYLHSRLLERAAKLSDKLGGGSITALPIVETQAGDVSAYIPTNIISITDGQIFLEADLFHSGVRPAVNAGISVSRVGGKAQIAAMKQVAGTLRLDLAQYRDLAAFSQFSSDLDPATKKKLERGKRIVEILKQPMYSTLAAEEMVASLRALSIGFYDSIDVEEIGHVEKKLITFLHTSLQGLLNKIADGDKLLGHEFKRLDAAIETFGKVLHTTGKG